MHSYVDPGAGPAAPPAHHLPGELCLERLRFALGSEASLRNIPAVVPQRSPSAVCTAMLGEGLDLIDGPAIPLKGLVKWPNSNRSGPKSSVYITL